MLQVFVQHVAIQDRAGQGGVDQVGGVGEGLDDLQLVVRAGQAGQPVAETGVGARHVAGGRLLVVVDGLEALQQGDGIALRATAIRRAGLQDRVAGFAVVAVGEHMVVGKDHALTPVWWSRTTQPRVPAVIW